MHGVGLEWRNLNPEKVLGRDQLPDGVQIAPLEIAGSDSARGLEDVGRGVECRPAVWAVEAVDWSGLTGWLMDANGGLEKATRAPWACRRSPASRFPDMRPGTLLARC